MIKFNEVTWYSKLATLIFIFGVFPILIFIIGSRYEQAKRINETGIQTNSQTGGQINSQANQPVR